MIVPENLLALADDVEAANRKWQYATERLHIAEDYLRESRANGWHDHAVTARERIFEWQYKEQQAAADVQFAMNRYRQAIDAATAQTAPDGV